MEVMAPIFRQFLLEDINSVAHGCSLYVKSNTYNCVKNEKRVRERTSNPFIVFILRTVDQSKQEVGVNVRLSDSTPSLS